MSMATILAHKYPNGYADTRSIYFLLETLALHITFACIWDYVGIGGNEVTKPECVVRRYRFNQKDNTKSCSKTACKALTRTVGSPISGC